MRKSCTLSLTGDLLQAEWYNWVDRDSPHAQLVWRSQFPGLLQNCLWYNLGVASLQANIRSVMWGRVWVQTISLAVVDGDVMPLLGQILTGRFHFLAPANGCD